MNPAVWVFGYGSLVSPASVSKTIGREIDPQADLAVAHLDGFGRRWNYGSLHLRGDWNHAGVAVRQGLVVSLGLEAAGSESCNGVAIRVTSDELAELDWRERDYERTDVSDQIRFEDEPIRARIVTYVPRPGAVERYRRARDDGRAAIRQSYWDLVHTSFDRLGPKHREHFSTTPSPDVPVVDITLSVG